MMRQLKQIEMNDIAVVMQEIHLCNPWRMSDPPCDAAKLQRTL